MATKDNLMDTSFYCRENDFRVKILETANEKHMAYQLRKEIYCDELHWVSCTNKGIEVDNYDTDSILIGAFDAQDHIIGTVRIIPAAQPMMIEREFLSLVAPWHRIKKDLDTAEASRLGVRKSIGPRKKSIISQALYKSVYQWSTLHQVRYLYIVVEKKMLRNLTLTGFSCHSIGPMVTMPDGTETTAAIIDWHEFARKAHFGVNGLISKTKPAFDITKSIKGGIHSNI